MRAFLFIILLFAAISPSYSQQTDRCGFDDIGNTRFENWLVSRTGLTVQTSTYRIPVVVHLLHTGEEIGQGFNYSVQRVEDQIRSLNDDFRRMEGTPGFNAHPDGADTRIEFVLAKIDPNGNPTNGIVRVNIKTVEIDDRLTDLIGTCAKYSYWDPDNYLNVWTLGLDIQPNIFLGMARFPVTDLPGGFPEDVKEEDGDGVFVNALNFGLGSTDADQHYTQGRTLTHEIGHFLGLLHTYSTCDPGDYCDDTPPVATRTFGCPDTPLMACDGRRVMIENYMDVSYDRCMNIFTKDQAARMHTVLNNSPRRKTLTTSPGLPDPVTGIPDKYDVEISIYPNPVTDKLFISTGAKGEVEVSIYTLLGKPLVSTRVETNDAPIEVALPSTSEKMIVVRVSTPVDHLYSRIISVLR